MDECRLSALKMSSYHLHLSDDDGYVLPSTAFPNLTSRTKPDLADWEVRKIGPFIFFFFFYVRREPILAN
jgi:hypothetical protein